MTAGMATKRPNAVVARASEIPPATAPIPEVFWVAIAWEALRIPMTVPSRPMNGNGVQRHYVDDVFLETADRLVADRGYFKSVPVQMHGMLVAGNILEDEPVPLSSLHLQRLNVGPRCAIDCPGVELRALL